MWPYSAVVRTLNSEKTLPQTLASLRSQISPPHEILVVDSGSTDNTITIAQETGATVLHYETTNSYNHSRALNIGFTHASTPFVLAVSSHVEMPARDTVSHLLEQLSDQSIVVAYCPIGAPRPVLPSIAPVWSYTQKATFTGFSGNSNCCAMYRKDDWALRPFDETIPTAEDLKWLATILGSQHKRSACLTSHGICYRNPRSTAAKLAFEYATISRHILTTVPPWTHAVRFIARAAMWTARGNPRMIRVSALAATYLLFPEGLIPPPHATHAKAKRP